MNNHSIDISAFRSAASVLGTTPEAATAEQSRAAAEVESARERGLLTLLLMADLLAA